MQVRLDQLAQHLSGGLRRLYTLHGDEPLLVQEASDAIRAAAREAGYGERRVYTVSGAHFDWSGLIGDAQAMSLFADKQLIEIRIPSGKPGRDGSQMLKSYCETLHDATLTLVALPKLDRMQLSSDWFTMLDSAGVTMRIDAIDRAALSQWIAKRLAAQGQRVQGGEPGQKTLAFFSDQVEGNLLAAHQEITKLRLLYEQDELSFEQVESAVLNVARYEVFKLGEAVLAGQVVRALRMLDGLQAEGEAAVLVHYTLASDILALKRVKAAVSAGIPAPMALRENRVWGAKERLFERILPRLNEKFLAELVDAAAACDGLVKGLKHPQWPDDPWAGLQRLVLMMCEGVRAAPAQHAEQRAKLRLALVP